MGSGHVTGVEVDNLHRTGGTIKGRAEGGRVAATGLKTGLDSASGAVGHGLVKGALTDFVTNHMLDDSNLLGHQLENGGSNIEFVAATAQSEDTEGGRNMQTTIGENSGISDRINNSAV